jgi:hypothetical protein
MRPVIFLAAATSLIAAAPSDSEACSPPLCQPGFFAPVNDGTVPANLPAFYWKPFSSVLSQPVPDPSNVLFARAAAPTMSLPFTATMLPDNSYLIAPRQPLTPGTQYVLTDQYMCGGTNGPSVTFQAAAAAPLPTSLGTLAEAMNLTGPIKVPSAGGECTAEVVAQQIGITLQPSAEALPWRDVLRFETYVDGQRWSASSGVVSSELPGSSWRVRGADLLYAVCKSGNEYPGSGLAVGPHEVVMRATVPGSTTVVESSALTVQLDCADAGPSGGDDQDGGGGCAASGPGSSSWLLLLGPLAALLGRGRRSARRPA